MGRFETLKPETQDMVNAMLPAIAASFKIDVENFKDIIPEDIRMRQWDCDKRDHIKDKTEDEPRNWGVQFLKELQAIARLNGNDLAGFQKLLREKVEVHAEKHPWARLEDIRMIKAQYQNPHLFNKDNQEEESSEESDSLDEYLEELVDADLPKGTKRGRNEAYESRVQGWWKIGQPKKKKKPVRLRRGDSGEGWDRRGKDKSRSMGRLSVASNTPDPLGHGSAYGEFTRQLSRGSSIRRQESELLGIKQEPLSVSSGEDSDEDIEVKKMQAELEAAEAELEVKRRRLNYWNAKEKAEAAKNSRQASTNSASIPPQNGRSGSNGYTGLGGLAGTNGLGGYTLSSGFNGRSGSSGYNNFNGADGHSGSSVHSDQLGHPDRQSVTRKSVPRQGASAPDDEYEPRQSASRQSVPRQALPVPDEDYEESADDDDDDDDDDSSEEDDSE